VPRWSRAGTRRARYQRISGLRVPTPARARAPSCQLDKAICQVVVCSGCPTTAATQRPNAHATISGNSSFQNAPPWEPARSAVTTSAPAWRKAFAHLMAFPRKNGSSVPATTYALGSNLGITVGGR
jgi:hypothetical protein